MTMQKTVAPTVNWPPMLTADGKPVEMGKSYWMEAGRDDVRRVKCVAVDARRRTWIAQIDGGIEQVWKVDATSRWQKPWARKQALLAKIRKELLRDVKNARHAVKGKMKELGKQERRVKAFDAWVARGCRERPVRR